MHIKENILKKNFINILPIMLLILAIGLSPRFPVGQLVTGKFIDIRIEDIILAVFGIIWLFKIFISKSVEFKKSVFFSPIVLWLGIGLFSTLINLLFMNVLVSRSFFYFLKEIEYFFLFFYVFNHIKNIADAKFFLKVWIFVSSINMAWIIFELLSGSRLTHYYGPTSFIEPQGTFSGGGFFLIMYVFFLNVFIYHYVSLPMSLFKKITLLALIAAPSIGVLSSGSRSAFVGLVAAMIVTVLLALRKAVFLRVVAIMAIIMVCVLIVFGLAQSQVLNRFSNLQGIEQSLDPNYEFSRPGIWFQQTREASSRPLFMVFGYGKAAILGGIGESHSQYVRNFVETGIVGIVFFFFLLYVILKKSLGGFLMSKDSFAVGVSAGLFCATIAMMAMSLFAEGFVVVKINEAYWFFAALTCFVIANYHRMQEQKSV